MSFLQAQETLQLVSLPSEYEYLDAVDYNDTRLSGPFLASKYRPYIPQSKFEVSNQSAFQLLMSLCVALFLHSRHEEIEN